MPQVSAQELQRLPLRVHSFLADVPPHDVWAIDLPYTRPGITLDEFSRTVGAGAHPFKASPATRALVNLSSVQVVGPLDLGNLQFVPGTEGPVMYQTGPLITNAADPHFNWPERHRNANIFLHSAAGAKRPRPQLCPEAILLEPGFRPDEEFQDDGTCELAGPRGVLQHLESH